MIDTRDNLGWRKKFGVLIPSTNTSVQPEFDAMAPVGVTNHTSRIRIPNMALNNDEDFARLIALIDAAQDEALLQRSRVVQAADPRQAMALFSSAGLVVAMRLHALILARLWLEAGVSRSWHGQPRPAAQERTFGS